MSDSLPFATLRPAVRCPSQITWQQSRARWKPGVWSLSLQAHQAGLVFG